jgi:hypothetical protein
VITLTLFILNIDTLPLYPPTVVVEDKSFTTDLYLVRFMAGSSPHP